MKTRYARRSCFSFLPEMVYLFFFPALVLVFRPTFRACQLVDLTVRPPPPPPPLTLFSFCFGTIAPLEIEDLFPFFLPGFHRARGWFADPFDVLGRRGCGSAPNAVFFPGAVQY